MMGEQTQISWTNATWNPWHGCAKVSAGCKNCYMFREKKQYGQDPTLVVRSKTKFNDPLKWVKTGKVPKYCFTCSWSDFFIAQADSWRSDAWEVIRATPQITYQILTKRPERIAEGLPDDWRDGYPNVWLGVSCENQALADERIPWLLHVPAVVRFISAEPLLGPIDLIRVPVRDGVKQDALYGTDGLQWVIGGGESGPGARPLHPDWLRSLRDQCQAAGVAFHFKQWGEWLPLTQHPIAGTNPTYREYCMLHLDGSQSVPASAPSGSPGVRYGMARIGTKAAGATLDGREWREFPR